MTKTTLRNSIEKEESAYDSLRGAANAANDLRNAEERAAVRLEVRSIGLSATRQSFASIACLTAPCPSLCLCLCRTCGPSAWRSTTATSRGLRTWR
jgi:hypothetical protein